MKRFPPSRLAPACALVAAAALAGCFATESNDDDNGGGTGAHFTLGVAAGEMNYLLPVDSLTGGTVSPVGNGLEVPGSGDFALQSGAYIYDFTRSTKNFSQYELKADGSVTKVADIAGAAYVADRAYSKNLVDDSTLLYIDPLVWGGAEMKWVAIRIPSFEVKASGTFTLPTIPLDTTVWRVNVGRAVVSGNKLYMGTVNYNATATAFLEGARAFVLDYPAMTNPTLVSTSTVNAELGITATANMFKTDNGDVYFAGSAGGAWGNLYGKPDTTTNYGTMLRIKNGQTAFDTSWVLDFSEILGEPTNVMHVHHVGGNTAVAVLFKDTDVAEWGDLDGDIYYFAKVDLAAKTVTKYNVPTSGSRLGRFPLIKDGTYYTFLKDVAGGTSRILEIDVDGGADAYTLGTQIQGSSVTGYGIYAHPTAE